MGVRRYVKRFARVVRQWLDEEDKNLTPPIPSVPFDNSYDWLVASSQKLWQDPLCPKRPQYIWGVLQGAALGKVLGMERISVIEFGVAGGAGLLALEYIADRCQEMVNIGIDVYGFDTGRGLPKPQDYRDLPNLFVEGQYALNSEQLEKRLRCASLKLGLVKDTVPAFIQSSPAPVAFVSFDVDLYSSTRDALCLFDAEYSLLLPRVTCYFDDIMGFTYSDSNGERLAITEFNNQHAMKTITPIYGLKYYVPPEWRTWYAFECIYFAHFFDHPLYNAPDSIRQPMVIDIEGNQF